MKTGVGVISRPDFCDFRAGAGSGYPPEITMNFGRAFDPSAFPANVTEKTQTQRLILTTLIKEFLGSSRGRA
jgi:hypothetical protein